MSTRDYGRKTIAVNFSGDKQWFHMWVKIQLSWNRGYDRCKYFWLPMEKYTTLVRDENISLLLLLMCLLSIEIYKSCFLHALDILSVGLILIKLCVRILLFMFSDICPIWTKLELQRLERTFLVHPLSVPQISFDV